MFYERKSSPPCLLNVGYIYTAYSIGSKSSAYRKSIVVARYIWKQRNVAKKKTISVVSTTKNYHCSQAVIGQLCTVSYRWLGNSIISTIINIVATPFYHSCQMFGRSLIPSARLSVLSFVLTALYTDYFISYRVGTVDVPESLTANGARGPWQQQAVWLLALSWRMMGICTSKYLT